MKTKTYKIIEESVYEGMIFKIGDNLEDCYHRWNTKLLSVTKEGELLRGNFHRFVKSRNEYTKTPTHEIYVVEVSV